jgi:NitT/TauT family transport system substrate-binding protein
MMTRTLRSAAFALGATILVWALGGPTRTAAQPEDVIHIGVSSFEAHGDVYYAQDLGLFKRAGLDVDIQQFQGGAVIVAAIVSGALQIGAGSPLPLAAAHVRGLPVVLIAPGYIYDSSAAAPIDALAVAANSPYRTGKDLNGKTIAVTALKSIDQIAVSAWIDQNGGDSSTVKLVEISQGAMVDAVADGRVDAAEIGDPALTAGIDAGKVRIIGKAYAAIAKRFFAAAWFSREDWAAQHPDVVRKFIAAINAGSAWAVRNPQQAAAVLRRYMKVTFAKAHEYHAQTLSRDLIQPILDSAAKYKILDPMDSSDLIWKGS